MNAAYKASKEALQELFFFLQTKRQKSAFKRNTEYTKTKTLNRENSTGFQLNRSHAQIQLTPLTHWLFHWFPINMSLYRNVFDSPVTECYTKNTSENTL